MTTLIERLRELDNAGYRPLTGAIGAEAADELERKDGEIAGLRESAALRVQYHAAELSDVTAERDSLRAEVAGMKRYRLEEAQKYESLLAEVTGLRADAERWRIALDAYERGCIISSDGAGYISQFVRAIAARKATP